MRFSLFASVPGFRHALSTRHGGVSGGPFASLNLAFHVGDNFDDVLNNRALWAEQEGFSFPNLVGAQQSHSTNVYVVTRADLRRASTREVPDCDALITREEDVPIVILVADCAPVLLVDPTKRVCAVVHAGWRGALAGIAGKALKVMEREWECEPSEVLAAIGPCLSLENLEVGEEVAAQVEPVEPSAVVRRGEWNKPHLDLRRLIVNDLWREGVAPKNIEVSPLCPKERSDLFFSHRGQNGRTGRFGLVAWWE